MPGIRRVKYQTDNGSVFNVLLDDSDGVTTLIGTLPTAEYTENMTVRVSKNNKEVGIQPRFVLLARSLNSGAADANCLIQTGERYKKVPVPLKTSWDSIGLNTNVNINGQTYSVRKKINEKIA